MMSNSDIHTTEAFFERGPSVDHRPVTLVFAETRSAEGIRGALDAARSVVWFNNMVLGPKRFVEPLFYNSIEVSGAFFMDEKGRSFYNLKNNSDFLFHMVDIDTHDRVDLLPRSSLIIQFDEVRDARRMLVENFFTEPDKPLEIILKPSE
jgi:hypothetical protein